jgi:hypothetical protein
MASLLRTKSAIPASGSIDSSASATSDFQLGRRAGRILARVQARTVPLPQQGGRDEPRSRIGRRGTATNRPRDAPAASGSTRRSRRRPRARDLIACFRRVANRASARPPKEPYGRAWSRTTGIGHDRSRLSDSLTTSTVNADESSRQRCCSTRGAVAPRRARFSVAKETSPVCWEQRLRFACWDRDHRRVDPGSFWQKSMLRPPGDLNPGCIWDASAAARLGLSARGRSRCGLLK